MAIVENVPYQIANRQTLKNPISDWIYEKLEDIPCVVKFDFPRNSLYFGKTDRLLALNVHNTKQPLTHRRPATVGTAPATGVISQPVPL